MPSSSARALGSRLPAVALTAGVTLWLAVFVLPLGQLLWSVTRSAAWSGDAQAPLAAGDWWSLVLQSFGWAGLVALCAVALGYAPGRLAGEMLSTHSQSRQSVGIFLLLAPLLLPAYVLYYAWSLPTSPTGPLGAAVMPHPTLARWIGSGTSLLVVVLWFWPLAALLLAQGWRNIDPSIMENAALDAGPLQRAWRVALPLLRSPLLLALAVCGGLALMEFTTFHLAGLRTAGTELAVMYDLTGSPAAVASRAWPMVLPAAAIALALLYSPILHVTPRDLSPLSRASSDGRRRRWIVLAVLLGVSIVLPVALLLAAMQSTQPLRQFLSLHLDELAWSAAIAALAAAASLAVAATAIGLSRLSQTPTVCSDVGCTPGLRRSGAQGRNPAHPALLRRGLRAVGRIIQYSILLAMFLPPVLLAMAVLEIMTALHLPASIRQSALPVSAGLVLRYAGAALVLLHLAVGSGDRLLSEMAAVDGANRSQTWWRVHWPRLWPTLAGAFVLLVMLGMTEVPATMILLPPGLPNFAQRLMNQMHYARDQQVIASCLVLCGVYALLAAAVALLLWRKARAAALAPLLVLALLLAGCDHDRPSQSACLGGFGGTGSENGHFVYPRAIDLCADGSIVVMDKTARLQRFNAKGEFLGGFAMPQHDNGKPTGVSVGPDGHIYVADTHYHRVMVFTPEGKFLRQWGQFGQTEGSFIYPTDVAFAGGKILVSEYGGDDRISVFDGEGHFLHSFGSPGSGEGEFARPQSMAVDEARNRLYVADACNHRIAVYDLKACLAGPKAGTPRYVGSAGTAPGELRYPYGLAIGRNGNLIVAEYGNNRIQIFDVDGRSIAVIGAAGREMGQLAYPWAIAVDGNGILYVVDSGNNRIQKWQL